MVVIGVTGNIACGKSTVDAMLLQSGATIVIDADRVVHDLQRDDPAVRQAIAEAFGSRVLAPDGGINRQALGSIVFNDPQALRTLEAILHPAVRRAIRAQIASAVDDAIVVIDAVKLLQGELAALVQSVWWVTALPEQQLERLRRRGCSEEAARARLAAQPPLTGSLGKVDVIIDNSGSLEDTRRQVLQALESVLAAHQPDAVGQ